MALSSKLIYMQQYEGGGNQLDLQVIGMSATLPNTREVALWKRAVLYETSFRPVPLDEMYKVGQHIFNPQGRLIRTLQHQPHPQSNPDHIVTLALETVSAGEQVRSKEQMPPDYLTCHRVGQQLLTRHPFVPIFLGAAFLSIPQAVRDMYPHPGSRIIIKSASPSPATNPGSKERA